MTDETYQPFEGNAKAIIPLFCGMRLHVFMLCLFPLAAVSLTGCDEPPIAWSDPVEIQRPADASRLVVDATGARFVPDSIHLAGTPTASGFCAQGFTTARGATRLYGAWWSVRSDSSASLVVATSQDSGKTWGSASAVDTTDVSSNGCRRPAPSLATVGDDVYIAYSMVAPEGTGVFFAHFMSNMLHTPVPVIYGERLVATAIAADANRVVVAYEEPNGRKPEVDVALSVSQGHLFEVHTPASRSVDNATSPSVAFNGSSIAVSWVTTPNAGAPTNIVRTGRIQRTPSAQP